MPSQPIAFGSLKFAKKRDAEDCLKMMLRRYDLGDRVNVEDAALLSAALARHPEAEAKIGCGVSYFNVRSADFGTKCFWINRPDGTTEKFSVKACIYG